MKKLALGAILAFAVLSLANAAPGGGTTFKTKGYSIVLAHPLKAGNVQLKAGEYNMKVDGDNAVFVNVETSKSISVPVKIVTSDKKFSETIVETTSSSGSEVLKDIELGGSTTKVDFSN